MKLTIEYGNGEKYEKEILVNFAWRIMSMLEPKKFPTYKEFVDKWVTIKD